jgi:hypothetical protein
MKLVASCVNKPACICEINNGFFIWLNFQSKANLNNESSKHLAKLLLWIVEFSGDFTVPTQK